MVAAVQMVSGPHLDRNLGTVERWVALAAARGAALVVLPENFALMDSSGIAALGQAESSPQGPVRRFLADLAHRHGVWLVAGSLPDTLCPDGRSAAPKVHSVCRLYDPSGQERCRYDKVHLFDAEVDDATGTYRESDRFEAGIRLVCTSLQERAVPADPGAEAPRIGLSICYDLRFPELYTALRGAGADLFAVPSAFTHETGRAHWEVLLRARAIENQVFVIAANQGGLHSGGRRTWGHSMIVDPWGRVLDEVRDDGEGLALAEVDMRWLAAVRSAMPLRAHRRVTQDAGGTLRLLCC